MQLEKQVALVTGGARGIGAAIAQALAGAGARVAIVDLDGAQAQATAAALSTPGLGLQADCSREAEMQRAVAQVVEQLGGLDILVNNAGGGRAGLGMGHPFTRLTEADWDETLAVNLRTAFAATKAAIPALQGRNGGSIVNVSSIAALLPNPNTPAYGAAKAGLLSLTRTLAFELAAKDIRVNAICPGLVWTRAWETLATMIRGNVPKLADVAPRDIFLDRVRKSVPLKREQTCEDIGALALFLCSPGARNITGQVISVDGGLTLGAG
jgi:NAD(P)-dependent dehydrogenase (short-subunit alcohol dehydrogenase family)